jgi:chromate reductase, NAD(P)H dehydrogenase (quinone)
MRVLGFTGSLRRDSYNRLLLQAAAPFFPREVVFDLWPAIADLPIYDEDLDSAEPPPTAVRLRTEIAAADAMLFATPEYNASIPGGLKNALDWASRPYATSVLRLKPVAVIGASTGFFGALWGQAELRRVLETCGARVLDRQLPVAQASEAFAADGSLADPALTVALRDILQELLRLVQPSKTRPEWRAGSVLPRPLKRPSTVTRSISRRTVA